MKIDLDRNKRRLLRNALRAYGSCPIDDREDVVALLYELEAEESATASRSR